MPWGFMNNWYQKVRWNLHPLDHPKAWRIARGSCPSLRFQSILLELGIRSAIDLRRTSSSDQEVRLSNFDCLGIEYHNIHLRSSDLPHPQSLQRFVHILDHAPRPLLLYCKRGKDKTGFGSALYRHLICGDSIEEAWQQLCFIPYGHRRRKHEGPYWFRDLIEQSAPADLRTWIAEEYPRIFSERIAAGEVVPITSFGENLPPGVKETHFKAPTR